MSSPEPDTDADDARLADEGGETSRGPAVSIKSARKRSTVGAVGVEVQTSNEVPDPLQFQSMKKNPRDYPNKKVQKFYEEQNELIDLLTEPLQHNEEEEKSVKLKAKIGIYGSLMANVILASLQLTAVIQSGSLSIIATMADAFMDLLSGAILLLANYLARSSKSEVYRYPTGKSRFETVGIIIFGSLMATASLQIIIEAVKRAVSLLTAKKSCAGSKEEDQHPNMDVLAISLLGAAIGTKFCLYMYCRLVKVPSVQVLAQDHRNDILLNLVALTMGILSDKLFKYEHKLALLDPAGAIFVALLMFRSWTITILEQGRLIAGKVADSNFIKRVTYLSMTHDDRIIYVESCRAYHCGAKVIAEVDIVLPPETTLQVAHDLGESLQVKLETMSNVERAFVHCDYNCTHEPEHQKQ